uniref:Uncharacterized protein n=2 Tax=viral metagenome TaxID=1070528 RepID=A0A6M3M6N1_9ZZZZ
MSKIQPMIDRGILEEEPDGMVYLSTKTKDIIAALQGDEGIMATLKRKATDEADAQVGFWTLVFMEYTGGASTEEIAEAVHTLVGWHQGAKETRLDEWSMQLRLGEGWK